MEQRKDGRNVVWEFMGIIMLTPSPKAGKDPCKNCFAKGLCDDGECGRKLFPIFDNDGHIVHLRSNYKKERIW